MNPSTEPHTPFEFLQDFPRSIRFGKAASPLQSAVQTYQRPLLLVAAIAALVMLLVYVNTVQDLVNRGAHARQVQRQTGIFELRDLDTRPAVATATALARSKRTEVATAGI